MKNKKQFMQYIVIIGLFVIGVIAFIFFYTHDYAYKMPKAGFQVVAGEKKNFEEGTTFIYSENGSTYKGANKNEYLNSTPIYFNDDIHTIILPQDAIYVNGRQAKYNKVESFSTLTNKKGIFYNNLNLDGGFIYNGRNTYTFLENMTVDINGKAVKVGAFSTIEVNDGGAYNLYNSLDKGISTGYMVATTCVAKSNDYSVDLLNDILYTSIGDKVLLYTKVDSLEVLK